MKLCAAQTDIIWENKEENLLKCRKMMEEAKGSLADLIVFPELSLTGFSMNPEIAEPADGETVRAFAELSREIGIAAGFGFACAHDGKITNRFCVAREGKIIAAYDKLHPFSFGGECSVYSAGDSLCETRLFGETVGLTVCYDLRFPEIYQALSRKCTLILVIANWPDRRAAHWETLLRARAIENQCYFAGINRCGSGGGLSYSGLSAVYSPDGELAVSAQPYKEQLIYAEINGERCRELQKSFPVKADRRRELYNKL